VARSFQGDLVMSIALEELAAGVVAIAVIVTVVGLWCLITSWLRPAPCSELRTSPRPGTIARVAMAIPAGGVGTVVHITHGRRQILSARAAEGQTLARGVEVVVVEHASGVAVVQPFPSSGRERNCV